MFKRVKFIADASQVVRSVGVSVLGIALAVYAMVLQERQVSWPTVILGVIILLIAAGGMLQVSRAVRQLHHRHDQVRKSAARAEQHYFQVLRRVQAVIEAREPYTRGRSKRVGLLARRIAERVGLEHDLCVLLSLAGQVHDIGLLAVPDQILNKPSRLGNQEFRTIQKHAERSYKILEPLTFLAEVLPAVRYHHERMNGTGYPFGLKGDTIPLTARILAVADAYDAMTHDRPHRQALSQIQALEELRRCSPAGYDPQCVEVLEEVMHLRPLREAHDAVEGAAVAEREDLRKIPVCEVV